MKTKIINNEIKRIAIVAPSDKRKELIEWSYANKKMLAGYELIATAITASLLEGTVNTTVLRLQHEDMGGYHQLVEMIQDSKVDVIFFFENPLRTVRPEDPIRKLLDAALEMNVVIAGNESRIDFMKSVA